MENKHYDVLVTGAGAAGVAAAVASAKMGRKTAIIERYGCIGGGITSMYVRPFMGGVKNNHIGKEIVEEIAKYQDLMSPFESAKAYLTKLLYELDVDVYLQTNIIDVKINGRMIENVIAMSFGEKVVFDADAYIDATGDGMEQLKVAGITMM